MIFQSIDLRRAMPQAKKQNKASQVSQLRIRKARSLVSSYVVYRRPRLYSRCRRLAAGVSVVLYCVRRRTAPPPTPSQRRDGKSGESIIDQNQIIKYGGSGAVRVGDLSQCCAARRRLRETSSSNVSDGRAAGVDGNILVHFAPSIAVSEAPRQPPLIQLHRQLLSHSSVTLRSVHKRHYRERHLFYLVCVDKNFGEQCQH